MQPSPIIARASSSSNSRKDREALSLSSLCRCAMAGIICCTLGGDLLPRTSLMARLRVAFGSTSRSASPASAGKPSAPKSPLYPNAPPTASRSASIHASVSCRGAIITQRSRGNPHSSNAACRYASERCPILASKARPPVSACIKAMWKASRSWHSSSATSATALPDFPRSIAEARGTVTLRTPLLRTRSSIRSGMTMSKYALSVAPSCMAAQLR